MSKWRVELKIQGQIRWLSHLDTLSLVERAFRRAKLPVAYSQGFNPHMLISWGPAHPVGLAGDGEYFDIEFFDEIKDGWQNVLKQVLPQGIEIVSVREIDLKLPALMSSINQATYRITFNGICQEKLKNVIDELLRRDSIEIVRRSPKGEKKVDIRPGIIDLHCDGSDLILNATLNTANSPKPQEVATILNPEEEPSYICRSGLYINNGSKFSKP